MLSFCPYVAGGQTDYLVFCVYHHVHIFLTYLHLPAVTRWLYVHNCCHRIAALPSNDRLQLTAAALPIDPTFCNIIFLFTSRSNQVCILSYPSCISYLDLFSSSVPGTLYSYVDSYTDGTRCQEIRSEEGEARFLAINKKVDWRYGAQQCPDLG